MNTEILRSARGDSIRQISVFATNKVGELNEVVGLLGKGEVHVMALCTQDTTDITIIRLVIAA